MERPGTIPTPPMTPEQQELNQLLISLMNSSTILVVKVAACECEKRETCGVYKKAKEIAATIDKIQELREKIPEMA